MSIGFFLLLTLFFPLALNTLLFIPAYLFKTDKLTDISYALTFFLLALLGLLVGGFEVVELILFLMILLWAVRLGGFLFIRINEMGRDKRFDGMRESFPRFFRFWVFQGATVWVVMLASIVVFAKNLQGFEVGSILGILIWLAGLLIESVADWQKYRFKSQPENKGRWIESGLWKYARHPNYFGEILVWLGVYLFALPYMTGYEYLIGLASPVYIFILLRFVSGVPILERKAEEKWGQDPRYQRYKSQTFLLVPFKRSD